MKEILYIKNKDLFGYRKICAIKEVGFAWGEGELNETNFGILEININDDKIKEWRNINKYCLNDNETAIIETPEEYLIKDTPSAEFELPKMEGQ